MRILLCFMLGVYSVGILSYALSEAYTADAGCATCFKGEKAFAGGAGTTGPDNRVVNLRYATTQNGGGFLGADATKISQVISGAANDWNTHRDNNQNTTPFNFQPNQNISQMNVNIVLVPKISDHPNACMQLLAAPDKNTGEITSATLYVTTAALANRTVDELKLLMDHELGHFIGLRDNYNNAQCSSIMSQAHDGCVPYAKGIQTGDVAKVRDYVSNPEGCWDKRGAKPHNIVSGGGYTDPNPIPDYYPRTCYYFYDAVDIYVSCDCRGGQRYVGTVYYLTDVFCNY